MQGVVHVLYVAVITSCTHLPSLSFTIIITIASFCFEPLLPLFSYVCHYSSQNNISESNLCCTLWWLISLWKHSCVVIVLYSVGYELRVSVQEKCHILYSVLNTENVARGGKLRVSKM